MPIEVEIEGVGMLEFPDDTPETVIQAKVKELTGGGASERTWTDTAVDAIPTAAAMGGGLLGAAGGPVASVALAGLTGAAGEGVRRMIQGVRRREALPTSPLDAAQDLATEGVKQAAGQAVGMGVGGAVSRLARVPMRMAFGAQKGVRNRFPGVNLEAVALREGVGAANASKAARMGKEAGEAVSAAGRAADAAGAAPIQPSEIAGGLKPLYDRAVRARMPEQARAIADAVSDVGRNYQGGINVQDALVSKTALQQRGRAALQSATDPRTAGVSSKIDAAMSRSLANAVKERGASVGVDVAGPLQRSQELMALEKATRNVADTTGLLRMALGGTAGAVTGASTGDAADGAKVAALSLLLTNPRALSATAHGLYRSAPAATQAGRLALLQLLSSHSDER